MQKEIVIEEKNNAKNNRKLLLSLAICGFTISIAVIVVAILYFVKVMPRSVAIHILYPGIALNMIINGFSMLKVRNKKIAIFDFIVSAVLIVVYLIMLILSFAG